MCSSLSLSGYNVSLLVADGLGDSRCKNIDIIDVGSSHGRVSRIIKSSVQMLFFCIKSKGYIFQLHDPELIPIGLILKACGKIVIFDSHEDYPKQILSKWYLNKRLRFLISKLYDIFEKQSCKYFDGIITPTDGLFKKFSQVHNSVVQIRNYPLYEPLEFEHQVRSDKLVYIGDITDVRGVLEMVKVLEHLPDDIRLCLIGKFRDPKLEKKARKMKGWRKVDYLGYVPFEKAKSQMRTAIAGLVLLHPTAAYTEALPVKLFDYMNMGIPVVATNIPLWETILEEDKCGFTVDPQNTSKIAEIINSLRNDLDLCNQMGKSGNRAIYQKYNWDSQRVKLLELYRQISSTLSA